MYAIRNVPIRYRPSCQLRLSDQLSHQFFRRKGAGTWRIDQEVYAASWDNGEGAHLGGGRWNSRGVRAVYYSL
ncbi:RES domain-containing protein, partial [Acidiphilium sp.]|uniref:RES domain-containing protein n=1 Tax=Acidiphilium sp. TaxID=527 RepID=UPI00338FBFFE